MTAKRFAKPLALVLALVLMLSALPLSGLTLTIGSAGIAASEKAVEAVFDENGNLANGAEAYARYETGEGEVLLYVTNDLSHAAERTYKVQAVFPQEMSSAYTATILSPFNLYGDVAFGGAVSASAENGIITVTPAGEPASTETTDSARTVTYYVAAQSGMDIENAAFATAEFAGSTETYTMDSRLYTQENMEVSLSVENGAQASVTNKNGTVQLTLFTSDAEAAPDASDKDAWTEVESVSTEQDVYTFEAAIEPEQHYMVSAKDALGYTANAVATVTEKAAPAARLASFASARTSTTLVPTNDLGIYGDETSVLSYEVPGLRNTGNTVLRDVELILEIPAQNSAGEQAELRVQSFSSGTYVNYTNTTDLTVSYRTNLNSSWRTAIRITGDMNVENDAVMPELSSGEHITALRYSFNEMPVGFASYRAPVVEMALYYSGLTENFTMPLKTTLSSPDLTTDQTSEDTVSVYNPLVTLTVSHRDIDTNAEIPGAGSSQTTMQAYTRFASQPRKAIDNYTAPTSGADVHPDNAIQYDSTTFSGYVGDEDVTIIHYYQAYAANIITPSVSTRYNPVYEGDRNVLYFDSIGTRLDTDSGAGNVPLKRLETVISVPEEMNVESLITPSFSNGRGVYLTVLYEINDSGNFVEYNSNTTMHAGDMYTVYFDLADGETVTGVMLRYEAADGETIPLDFYSLNRGLLSGTVDHDRTQSFTVHADVRTTGYYDTVNDSGVTETASQTKNGDRLSISVQVPQIISVSDGAAARLQAGDKFQYVLDGIASDGSVSYQNYTVSDKLPEGITVTSFTTGAYRNVPGGIVNITVRYADGTESTYEQNSSINGTIELNAKVNEIVISVPTAGSSFQAVTDPIISAVVDETAQRGDVLTNTVTVSADWESGNESIGTHHMEEEFVTETRIVRPEVTTPGVEAPNRLFITQTATYTFNHIGNAGDTEIYDFTMTLTASDNADITSVNTGSWVNTSWTGNALTLLVKPEDGDWEVLRQIDNLGQNATVPVVTSTGARAEAVQWLFRVAPVGFAAQTAPIASVYIHEDAEEESHVLVSAEVTGKFGPTAEADTSTIPDTEGFGGIEAKTVTSSVVIAAPDMTQATLTGPLSARFCDDYTYTLDAFANEGNTYLYNVGFDVRFSENFVRLNTGTWVGTSGYDVFYQTQIATTVTNEDGTESIVYEDSGKGWMVLAEDVTGGENHELTVDSLEEGEKVSAIAFRFGHVGPGFAMRDAASFTFKALDESEPAKEMTVDFEQYGLAGYAADEAAPTQAELDAMPYDFSYIPGGYTTVLIKPRTSVPEISIGFDVLSYREQFAYTVTNIANTGNTELDDFVVMVPMDRIRILSMNTPTFNESGRYNVEYQTNLDSSWQVWERNVRMDTSEELYAPNLDNGEYISAVRLNLGTVSEGFTSETEWVLNLINWSSAYETEDVVTTVSIGGKFDDMDVSSSNSAWYTPLLPELLQSGVTKQYPDAVYPKMESTAAFENVANNTEASVDYFALTEQFGEKVQPVSMTTGVYTTGLNGGDTLQVLYQTNKSGDGWYELESNHSVAENKTVTFPELVDEYITAVKVVYGTVQPGFHATVAPTMTLRYTEAIENHTTVDQSFTLGGFIDGVVFEETVTHTATADFGYVEVELINVNTGEKIAENGRYYGPMGQPYNITDYPLRGYRLVRIEGPTTGTMADGYTATVRAYYEPLPKTGEILAIANLLAGAGIAAAVGGSMIYTAVKKRKETAASAANIDR